MNGRQTPRNGVLAQYFEFVTTMTSEKSTATQRLCGAAAVLVPLLVLGAVAVLVLLAQRADAGVLVAAAGGLGLTLVRVRRRRVARPRTGHPDAGGS